MARNSSKLSARGDDGRGDAGGRPGRGGGSLPILQGRWIVNFADAEVEAAYQRRRVLSMARVSTIFARLCAGVSLLVVVLGVTSRGSAAKMHRTNALFNFGLCLLVEHFLRADSLAKGLGGRCWRSRAFSPTRQMLALSSLVLHLVGTVGLADEDLADLLRLERAPRAAEAWTEAHGGVLANSVLSGFVVLSHFPISWKLVVVHLAVALFGFVRLLAGLARAGDDKYIVWAFGNFRLVVEIYAFALLALAVSATQERHDREVFVQPQVYPEPVAQTLPSRSGLRVHLEHSVSNESMGRDLRSGTKDSRDVEDMPLHGDQVFPKDPEPVQKASSWCRKILEEASFSRRKTSEEESLDLDVDRHASMTRTLSEASEAWSIINSERPSCAPLPNRNWVCNLQRDPAAEPNPVLAAAMSKAVPCWSRIRKIVKCMTDDNYSVKDYFEDCVMAFPELQLFFLDLDGDDMVKSPSSASRAPKKSSSSFVREKPENEREYQRTIGALFAVYWVMRLEKDGKRGFCWGVDHNFETLKRRPADHRTPRGQRMVISQAGQVSEEQKRASFLATMDWSTFEDLISQAECRGDSASSRSRLMALVVLTAIHDVMKNEDLLPVVKEEHAPYMGYGAGVVIRDHDIALAYVMEYFPHLLPSYAGLPPEARQAILFTQSKLHFNHGWFVQAEGPPGAMLRTFKTVITRSTESEGADISFYFLHWLTDLAGAEATPMRGVEKLVVKFPQAVLAAFLWSIPFLSRLVKSSETLVVEQYLSARWKVMCPGKPVPTDTSAIARMRLVVMAQSDSTVSDLIDSFPKKERTLLISELSRTGCKGQSYSMTKEVHGGPAFLVYYGPALLQKNTGSAMLLRTALKVLSEVYRAARILWPCHPDQQDVVVTVNVAALKGLTIDRVLEVVESQPASPASLSLLSSPAVSTELMDAVIHGGLQRRQWVLVRHNDLEASVELLEDGGMRRQRSPSWSETGPLVSDPVETLDFSRVFQTHDQDENEAAGALMEQDEAQESGLSDSSPLRRRRRWDSEASDMSLKKIVSEPAVSELPGAPSHKKKKKKKKRHRDLFMSAPYGRTSEEEGPAAEADMTPLRSCGRAQGMLPAIRSLSRLPQLLESPGPPPTLTLPFMASPEECADTGSMDTGVLASLREENWLLRDQMDALKQEVIWLQSLTRARTGSHETMDKDSGEDSDDVWSSEEASP